MKQQTQTNKTEWQEVELEDITECLDGKRIPITESDRHKGEVPYYGANGQVGWIDKPIFNEELLLIAEDGGSWGKGQKCSYIINGKAWVNNHAHVLRMKKDKADILFLMYWLNNSNLNKYISGTTRGKLNQKVMNKIKIPLPFSNNKPDLKEQERIVSILGKAETLKQKGKNAGDLLDEYLKSVFNEMLEKISLENFDKETIEIIDGDRGTNYPNGNDFSEEGYCLFLNTGNVRKDGFNFDNLMFISKDKDEQLRKGKAVTNDVILTTRGTVGNVALYDRYIRYKNTRINSGMVLLRSNIDKILPKYLFYMIQMPVIQSQFKKMNSGTAQPQLPITNLKRVKIPIPPLHLQQKFAKIVEQVEKMKENVKKTKLNSDDLFNSLMSKAFRGEL